MTVTGLLGELTGYDDDPAGPWSLAKGLLIRNQRVADGRYGASGYDLIDASSDGRNWKTYRVRREQLQIGDVTAIRRERDAAQTIPAAPDGAAHFVWVYREVDGFSYAPGKRPEVFRDPRHVRTNWQSVIAFDADRKFLGVFNPLFPQWGWLAEVAADCGAVSNAGTSIAESIYDALLSLGVTEPSEQLLARKPIFSRGEWI